MYLPWPHYHTSLQFSELLLSALQLCDIAAVVLNQHLHVILHLPIYLYAEFQRYLSFFCILPQLALDGFI